MGDDDDTSLSAAFDGHYKVVATDYVCFAIQRGCPAQAPVTGIALSIVERRLTRASLAYNRNETRDKRPLDRGPDRNWWHHHTSVKLSWSQPMAPDLTQKQKIIYKSLIQSRIPYTKAENNRQIINIITNTLHKSRK